MNLVIQKSGKWQYVSFRESFWDPARKKYTSRTVKNFGRLDLLEKDDPDILNKLRAEAEESKRLRKKQKATLLKQRVDDTIRSAKGSNPYADNPRLWIGSCVYRQIWNKLNLQRKLHDLQKAQAPRGKQDFPASIFFMTTARSLRPDSKLAQWKQQDRFLYGASKLSLSDLYRSMDLLVGNREELIRYLNQQIGKSYHRTVTAALYDVTTYYFESQNAQGVLNYGFSKDCKVNQVQVVMGLLIDDQGVPISYEIFPGNTNEFGTMIPILEKLKKDYGIERVVVTADRGLNSGANLLKIREMGMDYVIAYRLRNAGGDIRKLILSPDGWTSRKAGDVRCDVSRYRLTTERRRVRVEEQTNGKTANRFVTVESNLLINYSPKRAAKDQSDRERLVEKAERLADNPALIQGELHRGGKSYLKFEKGTISAEVDREKIEAAKIYDGYYGIVYSDTSMSPERVMAIHHSLWQIEETFRISKSIRDARPCFHWRERRIRAHFLICYLALVMHRLLERELADKGVTLTADEIIDALRNAELMKLPISPAEAVYGKAGTNGNFESIAKAVGLGKLHSVATPAEVKKALKLKEL